MCRKNDKLLMLSSSCKFSKYLDHDKTSKKKKFSFNTDQLVINNGLLKLKKI